MTNAIIFRCCYFNSKTLLTTGQDDKEFSGIYVTPLRASTKPAKNWRSRVQQSRLIKTEEGHPRVWLLGDAMHAMQPNRYEFDRAEAGQTTGAHTEKTSY